MEEINVTQEMEQVVENTTLPSNNVLNGMVIGGLVAGGAFLLYKGVKITIGKIKSNKESKEVIIEENVVEETESEE